MSNKKKLIILLGIIGILLIVVFLLVYRFFYINTNYVVGINGNNYTSVDILNYKCNFENYNSTDKKCLKYTSNDVSNFIVFKESSLYLKSLNKYPSSSIIKNINGYKNSPNNIKNIIYDYYLNLTVKSDMKKLLEKRFNGFIFMGIFPKNNDSTSIQLFKSIYNKVLGIKNYKKSENYLKSKLNTEFSIINYSNLDSNNISSDTSINPTLFNNIRKEIFALKSGIVSNYYVHNYTFCGRGCNSSSKENFITYYFIYNNSITGIYPNYNSLIMSLDKKYNLVYY